MLSHRKKHDFWFCIWRSRTCFDNSTLASLARLTSLDVNVCLNSAASTGSLSSANEQWRQLSFDTFSVHLAVNPSRSSWNSCLIINIQRFFHHILDEGKVILGSNDWKQRLEAKYPTTPTIWTRRIVKLTMGPCWWQPSVFTISKQPDVFFALYVYYTCSTCLGSKSDMPWSGALP